MLAHRVSYLLFVGPLIPGLEVRHTCDFRRCVMPDHLLQGTHQENMDDMAARGRWHNSDYRDHIALGSSIAPPSAIDRFWEKVEVTDGCWLWNGGTQRKGDGVFWASGAYHIASRWIHEQLNGAVMEGNLVCHTCDNRICVRPDHLFEGTPKENMDDMAAKGRRKGPSLGNKPWNTRFREDEIRYIRQARGLVPQSELAREFNTTQGAISNIQLRRSRKSVD